MNNIMALILRIAYVAARQGLHRRSAALIGKVPPPGFIKEVASAWWAFADLCNTADDLEKKTRCHECGAVITE